LASLSTRQKLRASALRQWADPKARARILAGQRVRRLVTNNLALASWMAGRYAWTGLDFDDLRQAAILGLMKAAERYDPERGTAFSTVAFLWMRSSIGAEIAATRSTIRVPGYRPLSDGPGVGSLDAHEERPLPSDDEDGPEVGADRALLRERVGAALGTLPERDRFVVEMRFGINGARHPHTLDEIAPMLGVSRARVGQIEARALERLRFKLPEE
jgi:RNA polymerase sigma factor (sigma-70 family)